MTAKKSVEKEETKTLIRVRNNKLHLATANGVQKNTTQKLAK